MSQDLKTSHKNIITKRVSFRWFFIKHVNSDNIKPVFTFITPKVGYN